MVWHHRRSISRWRLPRGPSNDLSRTGLRLTRSRAVGRRVEMSQTAGLLQRTVPGIERQPMKKLKPDATAVLKLLERWRNEALNVRAGGYLALSSPMRLDVMVSGWRDG